MHLLHKLSELWRDVDYPFLIYENTSLRFSEIAESKSLDLSKINSGDVVALVGDFNPQTILTLLQLIEKRVIIVPLTKETMAMHGYFFETAYVDFVIEGSEIKHRQQNNKHEYIESLRKRGHAGLVLFSTGTTGRPKAILHDFTLFMQRYETPRQTLKTLNFLLFDHIGGINTLLHTLFNKGTVIAPKKRNVKDIIAVCQQHEIELLPTTPTFLRMMLLSGLIPDRVPKSLSVITYGTERMDQPTLDTLCELLPDIDFRQTYGMSELGILRVKSASRNSLFMRIGGEGVETRVVDSVLEIRSSTRMLGYLNASDPFSEGGWYNTKDIVEEQNGFYRITGRISEVINVGGLKFMASEVERVALQYKFVELAKAQAQPNPVTGEHVELTVQTVKYQKIDKVDFKNFLISKLPNHMVPTRIRIATVGVGHRFKRE